MGQGYIKSLHGTDVEILRKGFSYVYTMKNVVKTYMIFSDIESNAVTT